MEITVTLKCPDIIQAVGELTKLFGQKVEHTKEQVSADSKKPDVEAVTTETKQEDNVSQKYSQRAISLAGARLIQKDPAKIQAVHELLEKYGVKATKDLPEDSVDAFAEDLLGLGAEIDA